VDIDDVSKDFDSEWKKGSSHGLDNLEVLISSEDED